MTAPDHKQQPEDFRGLDLDVLEREGGTPPPYEFRLDGKRYMLSDPQSIDWQDLIIALRNPLMFLRMVLPPEDHREFFNAKLPAWKMNQLMAGYMKHYGLPDTGELSALSR